MFVTKSFIEPGAKGDGLADTETTIYTTDYARVELGHVEDEWP
jgi:hypothetical protein